VFLTLLVVTLVLAAGVSYGVARAFDRSIRMILERLVSVELAPAWARYVRFAILVVGVSGGVRIYALERYLSSPDPRSPFDEAGGAWVLQLDRDRWILEVYGTLIGTLQSLAWLLLVFFLFALIAYVVVRGFELRKERDTR
jgi:hypothetical protein